MSAADLPVSFRATEKAGFARPPRVDAGLALIHQLETEVILPVSNTSQSLARLANHGGRRASRPIRNNFRHDANLMGVTNKTRFALPEGIRT